MISAPREMRGGPRENRCPHRKRTPARVDEKNHPGGWATHSAGADAVASVEIASAHREGPRRGSQGRQGRFFRQLSRSAGLPIQCKAAAPPSRSRRRVVHRTPSRSRSGAEGAAEVRQRARVRRDDHAAPPRVEPLRREDAPSRLRRPECIGWGSFPGTRPFGRWSAKRSALRPSES